MTLPNFKVVFLNKFPKYATTFINSIKATHDKLPEMIAIYDSHDGECLENCTKIKVDNIKIPFLYSKYCNIGLQSAKDSDVILCNDDMECLDKDFFYRLQEIIYKYPKCGILSPLIEGGIGNDYQRYPAVSSIWNTAPVKIKKFNLSTSCLEQNELFIKINICFICIYIKREVINQIGFFDESFIGYGFDDDDYAVRAKEAGWEIGTTRQLHVKHGDGTLGMLDYGKNYSCTLAKAPLKESNKEIFLRKHKQYRPYF